MAGKGSGADAEARGITQENIDDVEGLTIQKVDRTISVLETSIAAYEASGDKDEVRSKAIRKHKRFRDALARWESEALRARGRKEPLEGRLLRLRRFVDICYMHV